MAATNPTLMTGAFLASSLGTVNASTQPLTASLGAVSYAPSYDAPSSTRYVLAGSLATVALGSLLSGCHEPTPMPMDGPATTSSGTHAAPPPNQRQCTPESTSRYCTSQRAVLQRMEHDRAEGHHADQTLFYISGGLGLVLGIGATLLIGKIWRGRKARAAARQAEQQQPQPAPAPAKKAEETPGAAE